MTQHGPQEIEIKLALQDEDAYLRLRQVLHPALGAVIQENRFFDGPNEEISSRKAVLRLRREMKAGTAGSGSRAEGSAGRRFHGESPAVSGPHVESSAVSGPQVESSAFCEKTSQGSEVAATGPSGVGEPRYILTLKTKGEVRGNIHLRGEVESPLPPEAGALPDGPDALLSMELDPIRALRSLAPDLTGLRDQGGFRNLREVYRPQVMLGMLQEALWELDRTEFPGGMVEFELELELPAAGESADLGREAEESLEALLEEWGIPTSPQPLSKYARYLRYRSMEGAD